MVNCTLVVYVVHSQTEDLYSGFVDDEHGNTQHLEVRSEEEYLQTLTLIHLSQLC